MKKILLLAILLLPILCFAVGKQGSYAIYFPDKFPNTIADDIVQLLRQGTAENWTVSKDEKISKGIVLAYENNRAFTSKESFHLVSNGISLLTITASSTEGLQFGIYKHLRSLGFRFYLPDDLYTIVPVVKNPFGPKRNSIDQPFSQIREFFATGGFGSGNSDSGRVVEKSWQLWKARNGFGAAYTLGGHRGENFILENKDVLSKHPEWLASPLYKNGTLNVAAKLNYQDKEALDFYINWTLAPFTKPGYKPPAPNITEFLSIEPSDGSGYANEYSPAKKLPSVSDQVFGAANQAAEKLDQLFPKNPNIGVNLYAYSTHAEPPSFSLHPRVFVQLVPYQFQNIAFGPSFIKMWSQKAKRFGIYDYFRYPDAQYDLPGGISLDQFMKRLVFSTKAGSEGTYLETSYSKFSTGIALWVVSRYLADGDADWNKNLTLLINDLYPKAVQPVQSLFTLFYSESNFNTDQLNNAVLLLTAAKSKATNPLVDKRLSDLEQYLYYTHLVLQSRDLSKGSLKERMLPVADYAWKVYQSKIIDSYRIMQLVSYSFLNADKTLPDYAQYRQLHADWFPETPATKAAWRKAAQNVSASDIEKDFALLKKTYEQPVLKSTAYTFNDVKAALGNNYKPKREFVVGGGAANRGYFSVYSENPVQINIRYTLTSTTKQPKVTISGIDKSYTTPLLYKVQDAEGTLSFNIPSGETTIFFNAAINTIYRFQINVSDGIIYFDGSPRIVMGFYKSFYDKSNTFDPKYYPSYIFFPKWANIVTYKVQVNSLQIYTPTKNRIESQLIQKQSGGTEVRQITVPNEASQKLWTVIITGNYNYNFLNIPDRYFLLEER